MKILVLYIAILSTFTSCNCHEHTPAVVKVYPTADTLPENLLRMYVLFSQPMKTVGNLEKIRLIDENGEEIKGAIFNNVHELWDSDQKQLTLIFDPARVKTGLQANESLGRALKEGQSYRLIIDGLEGINHNMVKSAHVKEFYVKEADTIAPDMNQWEIFFPKAKTKEALTIKFTQIMDQLSVRNRIVIVDDNNDPIKGTIELDSNEKKWHFTPMQLWKGGKYRLGIKARLADPSGNNLNGLFDHAIGSLKYKQEGKILFLAFTIADTNHK